MKVLKFGGTSVGSPERMENLYSILSSQIADKHLIVLSAVSGTTNDLSSIAQLFYEGKTDEAQLHIAKLHKFYHGFVQKLFKTPEWSVIAYEHIDKVFSLLYQMKEVVFTDKETRIILSQGEILSTTLFHLHLKERGITSVLLSALDFMLLDNEYEPDIDFLQVSLAKLLANYPEDTLFITQGYICTNAKGEIDNLRRGGSDYTASLIGAAIKAEEIQIWTDIDGFHNNDPRYVSNTRAIAQLSFDEAAELSYFGAKILHPQSVFPARKYNIPVRLLDTLDLNANGTLISSAVTNGNRIVAIAAKDDITAIRIESSRMLLAYGFLRQVFEIFEQYKTPIDMITTSEVAVSLTIDRTQHLNEIVEKLKSFGNIEIDTHQTIICIVGDFKKNSHGHATIVSEAVKHLPIRMISYGGSEHNISLLVPTTNKIEALRSLHNRLFV